MIVTVKADRLALAADPAVPRYADVVGRQPGWRFDLVVTGGVGPMGEQPADTREFTAEDIERALADAAAMADGGFGRAAVTAVWSGVEAALRLRLRADGEPAGWGSLPEDMVDELYSSGPLSADDVVQLETAWRTRNAIVHGFVTEPADHKLTVERLAEIARRLLADSAHPAQSAA